MPFLPRRWICRFLVCIYQVWHKRAALLRFCTNDKNDFQWSVFFWHLNLPSRRRTRFLKQKIIVWLITNKYLQQHKSGFVFKWANLYKKVCGNKICLLILKTVQRDLSELAGIVHNWFPRHACNHGQAIRGEFDPKNIYLNPHRSKFLFMGRVTPTDSQHSFTGSLAHQKGRNTKGGQLAL